MVKQNPVNSPVPFTQVLAPSQGGELLGFSRISEASR